MTTTLATPPPKSARNGPLSHDDPTPLSAAQDAAIAALLTGQTLTAAAKAAGVGRRTLHRWLTSDATFIATYRGFRAELRQSIQGALQHLAGQAVQVVRDTLTSQHTSPDLRARTALAVLRLAAGSPEVAGAIDREGVGHELAAEQRKRMRERLLNLPPPSYGQDDDEEDDA